MTEALQNQRAVQGKDAAGDCPSAEHHPECGSDHGGCRREHRAVRHSWGVDGAGGYLPELWA